MQHLKRDSALEAVELFRRLDAHDGESLLTSAGRADDVIQEFSSALIASLADESRVHGWRMQSLFRSLVVALDGCLLMTYIDRGEVFFDGDRVKPADFFLHLRDGRRILVDVKSHRARALAQDPFLVKFGRSEIDGLRRFGELYGAEVFLAIHFEGGNWTLVPLSALETGPSGGYRIGVEKAMTVSHLGLLGDQMIGTTPPIELTLLPNPSAPNHVDGAGHAHFTVGSFSISAGGRVLEGESARTLAFYLLQFGEWLVTEHSDVRESRLVSLSFIAAPESRNNPGENFEFVGSLARLFSRQFEGLTSTPDGVVALDFMPAPGALKELIPRDVTSSEIPLWLFELVPSGESEESTAPL